jgi:hypothetical protein
VRALGLYALIAFGLWQAQLSIVAFAGHETSVYVHAILEMFADFRVSIFVTLAGGAGAWAVAERLLRQRMIVRLHTRIKELETQVDPGRSSSGLTRRGQTNPQDRKL